MVYTYKVATSKNTYIKSLSASSIGALFECYDFMICAFLAPTLTKLFFHGNTFWGVFAIFSIAFFSRPLGGLFWGYLGDIYGRKKAFSSSMILLSIPTLLIALFPLHLFSTVQSGVLFALLRFAQGFFVGGEFPGGVVFVAESSKSSSRGFNIAIFMSALTGGTLLASLSALVLNISLSKEQIANFGWRIPFLFGLVLVFVAIYIRKKVHETPFFAAMQESKTAYNNPLMHLFKSNKLRLLNGLILVFCSASGLTTLYVFFPQMMNKTNFSSSQILLLTTLGSIVLCVFMPIMGWLSDRIKRKILFIGGLLGLIVGWSIIIYGYCLSSMLVLIIGMSIGSLAFSLINGAYCAMLSELFPTNIRYSGVAFCYSVGYSLCGGLLPLLYNCGSSQLIKMTIPLAIFFILVVVLVNMRTTVDYRGRDLAR